MNEDGFPPAIKVIGGIVLFVVLIAWGVSKTVEWFQDSHREREFSSHMDEYVSLLETKNSSQSKLLPSDARFLILEKGGEISTFYHRLPEDLRAEVPEQVSAIGRVTCELELAGEYSQSGSEIGIRTRGYIATETYEIFDPASDSIIAKGSFRGPALPEKTGVHGELVTHPDPREIHSWLRTLRQREKPYVEAWGLKTMGQTYVPADLRGVTSIAAGYQHTVALKDDGTVAVWGNHPKAPEGLVGVDAIAAGNECTVALKGDGTVVVWGIGDGPLRKRILPEDLNDIIAVAAGGRNIVALKSDGTVVVWRANSDHPGDATRYVPTGMGNVIAVSAGDYHTVALKDDGTVITRGIPTDVPADLSNVTAVAAGNGYTVALKSDGTIVAWGADNTGRPDAPTTVPQGLRNVIAIAAGGNHIVALKSDGTVVSWGSNSFGQADVPMGLRNVTAIAAGGDHTVALVDDRQSVSGTQNESVEIASHVAPTESSVAKATPTKGARIEDRAGGVKTGEPNGNTPASESSIVPSDRDRTMPQIEKIPAATLPVSPTVSPSSTPPVSATKLDPVVLAAPLIAMRTWTDQGGRTLEAELISVNLDNETRLYTGHFRRPDGTSFDLLVGKLSANDVDLIRQTIGTAPTK